MLYQQRVTDVNTMFKVFRAECLDGLDLARQRLRARHRARVQARHATATAPMEVPVNYVARGFDDGKKIRFWRDFFPSYLMFFKCRFGRRG